MVDPCVCLLAGAGRLGAHGDRDGRGWTSADRLIDHHGDCAMSILPRGSGLRDLQGRKPWAASSRERTSPWVSPAATGPLAGRRKNIEPGRRTIATSRRPGDRARILPEGSVDQRDQVVRPSADARVATHRRRRPTGAAPPLPKQIGPTGWVWLILLLAVVITGCLWLRVDPTPLDGFDAQDHRRRHLDPHRVARRARAPGAHSRCTSGSRRSDRSSCSRPRGVAAGAIS